VTLLVHTPDDCVSEARWVCNVMLGDFLGQDFTTSPTRTDYYRIESAGRCLEFPNLFLARARDAWLTPASLAPSPLPLWDISTTGLKVPLLREPLPILFGKPTSAIASNRVRLGVDIFGTAFYLLSRYEETVLPDRDDHDRFPGTASLNYRCSFLHRPLVNEYLEVLWAAMKFLWPRIERKRREPTNVVSVDLDAPYQISVARPVRLARRIAGDLIRRRSPRVAAHTAKTAWNAFKGNHDSDPSFRAIDWIMDRNEAVGNKVTFFFFAGRTSRKMDGCYDLDDPAIRRLMQLIHGRGHEIGLHGSYGTYRDGAAIAREAANLRRVLDEEGIKQEPLGSRQHYLRWSSRETAHHLDLAGLAYDSTLGYADRPGFRCGTCYEYIMYDVVRRRTLSIRQRPLIVMESSVLDRRYLNMGHTEDALAFMQEYKDISRRFGGCFTLLWHNTRLTTEADRRFYLNLIA